MDSTSISQSYENQHHWANLKQKFHSCTHIHSIPLKGQETLNWVLWGIQMRERRLPLQQGKQTCVQITIQKAGGNNPKDWNQGICYQEWPAVLNALREWPPSSMLQNHPRVVRVRWEAGNFLTSVSEIFPFHRFPGLLHWEVHLQWAWSTRACLLPPKKTTPVAKEAGGSTCLFISWIQFTRFFEKDWACLMCVHASVQLLIKVFLFS